MTVHLTITAPSHRSLPTDTLPATMADVGRQAQVRPFVPPALVKLGQVAMLTQQDDPDPGFGGSLDFP